MDPGRAQLLGDSREKLLGAWALFPPECDPPTKSTGASTLEMFDSIIYAGHQRVATRPTLPIAPANAQPGRSRRSSSSCSPPAWREAQAGGGGVGAPHQPGKLPFPATGGRRILGLGMRAGCASHPGSKCRSLEWAPAGKLREPPRDSAPPFLARGSSLQPGLPSPAPGYSRTQAANWMQRIVARAQGAQEPSTWAGGSPTGTQIPSAAALPALLSRTLPLKTLGPGAAGRGSPS